MAKRGGDISKIVEYFTQICAFYKNSFNEFKITRSEKMSSIVIQVLDFKRNVKDRNTIWLYGSHQW